MTDDETVDVGGNGVMEDMAVVEEKMKGKVETEKKMEVRENDGREKGQLKITEWGLIGC